MADVRYHVNRPTNWLLAALYGAVGAIIIAYGFSYLSTHLGFSVINLPEGQAVRGPEVLKLAALNLYAVQHITLVGSGRIVDPLGAGLVNAQITLPITIWILIPALGLILGGYVAAKLRSGHRRDMLFPAVIGAILYGIVLVAAAWFVRARVGSFLLPEIEGIGANPPAVIFRPALISTFIYATGFGLVFMYLGSLFAVREEARGRTPGRWHACAKAVVVSALVLQLLIAVTSVIILRRQADTRPVTVSMTEIMPTVTGIAYGLLYGGTLKAEVSSRLQEGEEPQILMDYRANLYSGIERSGNGEEGSRAMSSIVVIAGLAIASIVAFVSGWLAVRWGSTDGSIPTALRLVVCQATYLGILVSLCNLVLMISNKSEAFTAISATVAGLSFSWLMVPAMLCYFFVSLLGAYTAHRRFSASPTGFPHSW